MTYLTANTIQFTRSYLSFCDDLLKVYSANRHQLITSAFTDIFTAHVNCLQRAASSDKFKHEVLLLLKHPFNGLFSRTTSVCRYQKGRAILDFNEARDDGWQWHQLDHMQIICTSLQTHNHTSTSSLNFYGPYALPNAQPTVSKN